MQRHRDRGSYQQERREDHLEHLRRLRGPLGTWSEHPLDQEWRRHEDHEWPLHGGTMEAPHVGGGGGAHLSSNTGASASCVENALTSSVAPANTSKGGSTITREHVSVS